MSVVVAVGLNHRTVPLEVLERMTVSDTRLPKALHDLRGRTHVAEAVLVSTCMRTEIYVVTDRFHGAAADVRDFLCEWGHTPPEILSDHLYSFHDDAAAAHLFEVAAGLDSAVLGETEILGQVRNAWERARHEGAAGAVLSALFRQAVEVGKRARSETAISRGTTSLSHAALALAAERLDGTLAGRSILVLGAGEMGEGMALALAGSAGVAEVLVANRTWARAVELARRVGGRPVELGAIGSALEEVDVLLTSTGSPAILLEVGDLEAVLPARSGRPLLIVDVAVPRDVDPAVGRLPGVTLLDMNDLRAFAEAGMAGRRREVATVREIIAEEVLRYSDTMSARTVVPLVTALRQRAEALRAAEIERYQHRLEGLDDEQREAVEALTRGLLNKLLHEPTVRLKDAAGTARGDGLAEAVRALFDI